VSSASYFESFTLFPGFTRNSLLKFIALAFLPRGRVATSSLWQQPDKDTAFRLARGISSSRLAQPCLSPECLNGTASTSSMASEPFAIFGGFAPAVSLQDFSGYNWRDLICDA
jgi:hypothetical protein